MSKITDRLKRLKDDVDEILKEAFETDKRFYNMWCGDALFCISWDGTETYQIQVRKYHPDKAEVHKIIREGLTRQGWKAELEIILDWT